MFCVWMQLTTSVKSITTSLPTVMAAMTFLTASFFFSIFGLASSSLSSWISPVPQQATQVDASTAFIFFATIGCLWVARPQNALLRHARGTRSVRHERRAAPFLVVWKYLESLPDEVVPPKFGSLVFMAADAAQNVDVKMLVCVARESICRYGSELHRDRATESGRIPVSCLVVRKMLLWWWFDFFCSDSRYHA